MILIKTKEEISDDTYRSIKITTARERQLKVKTNLKSLDIRCFYIEQLSLIW